MNQQETAAADQFVFSYLKKRGFKHTEQTFKQEASDASLDQFVFDASCLAEARSSSSDFILQFASIESMQPKRICDSFVKLKTWIEDSLDLYKLELQSILYPLFVHTYLDLIARDYCVEAKHFYDTQRAEFAHQYQADMLQLATVTAPHHLRENEMAKLFRENKYLALMSSYAFELLIQFLQDSKFAVLLKFINQYIDIKVYTTKPLRQLAKDQEQHNKSQQQSLNLGITGHTSQQMTKVNQQVIYTGTQLPSETFQNLITQKIRSDTKQESKPISRNNVPDESLVPAAVKYRDTKYDANHAAPKDMSAPQPPLTNADVLTEITAIKDMRARISIGAKYQPSVVTYTVHNANNTLTSLSFNPDITMAAAGFSESVIKIWSLSDSHLHSVKGSSEFAATDFEHVDDPARGRELNGDKMKKLIGHSGAVYGTCFSPDSKYLASCSEDGTARLWSTDTFTNLVAYRGHNYPIWDIDFGPHGVYFATASHDRTARLWSVEHINPLRIFASHLSDVDCVKFHPNNNYVVTGSSDRTVRMWDIHRGRCVRVFTGGHPTTLGSVMSVSISPNGHIMASGGDDGSVVLWDLGSGKMIKRMLSPGSSSKVSSYVTGRRSGDNPHLGTVYSLDFSKDGNALVSGSSDGTVCVWDVSSASQSAASTVMGSSVPTSPATSIQANSSETWTVAQGKGAMMDGMAGGGKHSKNDCLGMFQTKRTPVFRTQFTARNLIVTGGPFLPY